jgi:hypothetical protein
MGMTDEERHCEKAGQPFNPPSKPTRMSLGSRLSTRGRLLGTLTQRLVLGPRAQKSGHGTRACVADPCGK